MPQGAITPRLINVGYIISFVFIIRNRKFLYNIVKKKNQQDFQIHRQKA